MSRTEIEETIRSVLATRSQVELDVQSLSSTQSLYEAGMTSHSTVKVMLGLEDAFDVEFPDEFLERSIFDQIDSIANAVEKLLNAR
jgi:acyl carrier protein